MDNDTNDNQSPDLAPEVTAPVVPDNEAPVQTEFAPPSQKRRSPKLLIAGVVAAALVLIGGGSALAYTMWYQNPDKVVHDAISNLIQAKTLSTTGKITYKGDDFSMDISLDSKGNEQGHGELTVDAKVSIDTPETKQDFTASGVGRVIDDTLYIKLGGIQGLVEDIAKQSDGQIPEYASAIYEKIEDKWISIKASDYEDIDEDISKQQTCLTDLAKKMQSDKTMSDEVMKLYRDNQIVVVTKELGSKSVNGNGSLGYEIEFDKDKTVSLFEGLDNTTFGQEAKKCDEDISFSEMAKSLKEDTSEIESDDIPTVELWVSRFGHDITEFSVRGGNDEDGTYSALLNPVFDKEVTVETPQDATPLKTVLEDIQSTIMEYYMEAYSEEGFMIDDMEAEMDLEGMQLEI